MYTSAFAEVNTCHRMALNQMFDWAGIRMEVSTKGLSLLKGNISPFNTVVAMMYLFRGVRVSSEESL